MRIAKASVLAAVCALGKSGVVVGDVIYDAKGFEEFDQGFIGDGQDDDGWYAFDEGVWPLIWVGTPSEGNKSVLLRLNFVEGGESGMFRHTDDLIADGYARVTVSFDVYRQSSAEEWFGDLWWRCGGGNGNPGSGGQYNRDLPLTSRTYPFVDEYDPFTNDIWVDTRFDAWTTVELTWDFQTGFAYGSYDGVLVSTKQMVGFGAFEGCVLDMTLGGAPEDFHWEWAWIDNFIITGEKGGCYPDFTGDGVLDLFDFLAYVNNFNAGDPAADCTGDGVLDLFDFLCFVNAFNGGC